MLVFVYGTLRKGAENDAEKFVGAEYVGPAKIFGKLYDLGWYPGLKLGGSAPVIGDVFKINQEQLERLDAYEGVPDLYLRRTLTTAEGCLGPVFVYEYNGPVHPRDLVESGDWLKHESNHPI